MNETEVFRAKNFSIVSNVLPGDLTGASEEITYVNQPPVAIAVPLLDDETVLLVEQWRPLMNQVLLECPGGKVDPGETVEEAVVRELEEEIGLRPRQLAKLGSFFTSVGSSNERIHCFLATDFQEGEQLLADAKRLRLQKYSIDKISAMLRREILPDGKTYIALRRFLDSRL